MKPIPPSVIDRLKLERIAEREFDATQNLLPPEPDWSQVPHYSKVLARVVTSRLGAGMDVRPAATVSARKSRHGLRPLSFLGLPERVTYLALTTAAVDGIATLNRGAEDWLKFSKAPAEYGKSLQRRVASRPSKIVPLHDLMPFNSQIKYVVRSDVVAFYRHVDHQLLADQLILRGANFEVVTHLVDFLNEVEGRAVGLPQLYEASDILSEVYIDAVERDMLRRGHAVWRFNDDFRVACKGYMDALRAIEDLDESLRQMGLTLNEGKTTTPTFPNYYMEVLGLEVSKSGTVVARQEVEDIVGDYTDDFSQSADTAAKFLSRIKASAATTKGAINIKDAGPEEARLARRALAALARHRDQRGLAAVPMLVRYLAELTPAAIRYLIALHRGGTARTKIAVVLDELAEKTATNDWQKMWLTHGYVATKSLTLKRKRASRLDWLRNWHEPWSTAPLRAYVVWALASTGELSVDEVLKHQRNAPECLHLYYADAARILGQPSNKDIRKKAFTSDLLLQGLAAS